MTDQRKAELHANFARRALSNACAILDSGVNLETSLEALHEMMHAVSATKAAVEYLKEKKP